MIPQVDVIVPCYNYGRYLRSCVDSILRQPGVCTRILIIDDASTDNTREVASSLAAQDSRVEYQCHPINRGHINTYNEGIDWLEAEYHLLISADDMLIDSTMQTAVSLLRRFPTMGLAFGRQVAFEPHLAPQWPLRQEEGTGNSEGYSLVPGDDFIGQLSKEYRVRGLGNAHTWAMPGVQFLEMICKLGTNPIPSPTTFLRTSAIRKVGGYRGELPHTGDLEICLRVAAQGSVGVIAAPLAFKRMHSCNMQREYVQSELIDLQHRKAAFDWFFDHVSAQQVDRVVLQRYADESLSTHAFWAASRMFDDGKADACRTLLAFAKSLDSSIPRSWQWRKMRLKQHLGYHVWAALRPWIEKAKAR